MNFKNIKNQYGGLVKTNNNFMPCVLLQLFSIAGGILITAKTIKTSSFSLMNKLKVVYNNNGYTFSDVTRGLIIQIYFVGSVANHQQWFYEVQSYCIELDNALAAQALIGAHLSLCA